MSSPALRIETMQHHEVLVLKPIGWVAADGHVAMEEKLQELVAEGHRWMVVDLSAAHFVSSTGLGVFLYYHKVLAEKGGRLVLAAPGGAVSKMLAVANLDRVLAICATLPEAVERARRNPRSSRAKHPPQT
jgi:anti-sigma B factor antagonist